MNMSRNQGLGARRFGRRFARLNVARTWRNQGEVRAVVAVTDPYYRGHHQARQARPATTSTTAPSQRLFVQTGAPA